MTIFRIKNSLGLKIESVDKARMLTRLTQVQKQDPSAKLLTVPVQR